MILVMVDVPIVRSVVMVVALNTLDVDMVEGGKTSKQGGKH